MKTGATAKKGASRANSKAKKRYMKGGKASYKSKPAKSKLRR